MTESSMPSEWHKTTLGAVAQWGSGGTPSRKNPDYYGGNVPWVKTGDLGPKVLSAASEYITELGVQKSSAKYFPKGSVVIAMYGATIGKTSILGFDATTNQACAVGQPVDGITDTTFLYYLLRNEKDAFIAKGKGGAQPNISQALIKEHGIALPPLAEQKVIADKLDTLLAQVENTKARLERIPQILKRFRQSVLAAAVSGRLTEEWRALHDFEEDSWSSMPLKNIAEVLDPNPSHRYPKPESGGIPILSTQQFDGYSGWTTDKAKHVSRDFFDERKGKCGFYEDDIIFARKGRLGLARFAPKGFDYVYSHTVFIIRPYKNVNPAFLLWSLRPDSVVDYLLMAMNSNTGVPTLGKGVFEKMEVNVPSPEEQTEIVRQINQLFAHAYRIEQQVNNALARVNNLTQSILAKAFRGELTEQWRKDNPELISGENSAEALLERIKAERATASKPKRRKANA